MKENSDTVGYFKNVSLWYILIKKSQKGELLSKDKWHFVYNHCDDSVDTDVPDGHKDWGSHTWCRVDGQMKNYCIVYDKEKAAEKIRNRLNEIVNK